MPRYRTAAGVVINIPEEKAARLRGLTPLEAPPSPARKPRKATKPKPKKTTTKAVTDASTDDHTG